MIIGKILELSGIEKIQLLKNKFSIIINAKATIQKKLIISSLFWGLYLTYEELKLKYLEHLIRAYARLYLTYEELKPLDLILASALSDVFISYL